MTKTACTDPGRGSGDIQGRGTKRPREFTREDDGETEQVVDEKGECCGIWETEEIRRYALRRWPQRRVYRGKWRGGRRRGRWRYGRRGWTRWRGGGHDGVPRSLQMRRTIRRCNDCNVCSSLLSDHCPEKNNNLAAVATSSLLLHLSSNDDKI